VLPFVRSGFSTMSVSLPGVPNLTREQLDILESCPPPTPSLPLSPSHKKRRPKKGQLTRITAAAGSGKTTTLLALAVHAARLGHKHLTYVTFTNSAAKDGKERLDRVLQAEFANHASVPPVIDARTLHSCAHRLLQKHLEEQEAQRHQVIAQQPQNRPPPKLWSEKSIKRWISEQCRTEIDSFLQPCFRQLDRYGDHQGRAGPGQLERQNRAREQVEFFIYKSLVHFCQSAWTLETYETGKPFNRDYFPAKNFHGMKGKGESFGFHPSIYNNKRKIGFYADQAARLWKAILRDDIRSFDFEMKRVQLLEIRVPGSILLVDESQDMDACQIDFIARQQIEFGTHVFVVGDAVQSIYGFRGARPGFLLNLRGDVDLMLTESWRFGTAISNFANFILYAKQKSEQTGETYDGKPKNWIPYRTRPGLPNLLSRVTSKPLISEWRSMKVTIIARTNATLLLEALGVLGFVFEEDDDGDSQEENEEENDEVELLNDPANSAAHVVTQEDDDDDNDNYETFGQDAEASNSSDGTSDSLPLPQDVPRIHINGRGESSGLKLWKKTLQLVESVYELYRLGKEDRNAVMVLDSRLFPDFARKSVTWKYFCDECTEKELSRYNNVINIVNTCKKQTMAAMETFKEHVMERKFSAEEAHIILTTGHSSKGMEWDNVQVCNDFVCFADFKKKAPRKMPPSPTKIEGSASKKSRVAGSWEFSFQSWGDDVNLAYVACTRAKQVLSIPKCIHEALGALDIVHTWIHTEDGGVNNVAVQIPGYRSPLPKQEADDFFQSLVLPLREELGLQTGDQLLAAALVDMEEEDANSVSEEEDESEKAAA